MHCFGHYHLAGYALADSPLCALQAPKATQVVPGVVQGPIAAQVGYSCDALAFV